MAELPGPYRRFVERYPEIAERHETLALAVNRAGPLDARARRLVHLGIAIGAESCGGVKSHARRALEEGLGADELRQAALLGISTAGFPAMVAAAEWIEEVIAERAR